MTLARLLMAVAFMAAMLPLGTAQARPECNVWRTLSRYVAPTTAYLETNLNSCAHPDDVWFEMATSPDLVGARWIFAPYFAAGATFETKVEGLKPETTYYFRTQARWAAGGTLTGAIESFRTPASADVLEPKCWYLSQEPKHHDRLHPPYTGQDGLTVDFRCNGFGYQMIMRILVGRDPAMAGATVRASDAFHKGLPLDLPISVFLPYDCYMLSG